MKKFLTMLLALTLVFTMTACGAKPAEGWQEEIDKGVAAVESQNYETAITAFETAITIDPVWEEAYIKLADTYIITGDIPSAINTLKNAAENLENGSVYADKALELKNNTIIYLDGDRYELNENGRISKIINETGWFPGYFVAVYDENGKLTKIEEYDNNDTYEGYVEFLYNEDGVIIHKNRYNADNELSGEFTYEYDETGNLSVEIYQYDWFGDPMTSKMLYTINGIMTETYSYNKDVLEKYYKYDSTGETEEYIEYKYYGDMTLEKVHNGDYVLQKEIYRNAYISSLEAHVDLISKYINGMKVSDIAYYTGTEDLVSEQYYDGDGLKSYDVSHNDKDIIVLP